MKPIAEIVWAGGIEGSIKDVRFYKVPSPDVGTKLYTHLVKELTDKEIEELKQVAPYYGIESDYPTGVQEFIKAILRKAQEK